MHFLHVYNEVELFYTYNSTLRRVRLLQSGKFYDKRPKCHVSYIFNKVIEVDFERVYMYILLIWLMTGKYMVVDKVGHILIKGVRYYRFTLNLSLSCDSRFFKFVDLILYDLYAFVKHTNFIYFTNNLDRFLLLIYNVYGFSNIRFSDSYYLGGVNNVMNFALYYKTKDYYLSSIYFSNLLKLC